MIEPQNTMMPLPAESAPAEVPHGEAGFGEMLAQTLGMVQQMDPSAISRIMGDAANHGHDGDHEGDPDGSDSLGPGGVTPAELNHDDHVSVARYITIPVEGMVPAPVSDTGTLPRLPVADGSVVDPEFDEGSVGLSPVVATEVPIGQDPLLPRPAPVPPGDGIWDPVLSDHPDVASAAVAMTGDQALETEQPDHVVDHLESDTVPARDAEPTAVQPGPVPAPSRPAPISPPSRPGPAPVVPVMLEDPVEAIPAGPRFGDPGLVAAEPVRSAVSDKAVLKPVGPIGGPGLPIEPTPVSELTGAPAPTEPIVELNADAPVRFRETGVQLKSGAVPVADSAVAAEPASAAAPIGIPTVSAVQPQAVATSDFAAPTTPTQHSALAARVMQAIELQANQPPPRTMVVDIPEIEGLRLVVSVRSGAEVHVVPSTSSTASDGLQSFMDELQGVLDARGFVMTGDGRRRGSNPHDDERPEPQRAQRPLFRRPQPTDNDLRI